MTIRIEIQEQPERARFWAEVEVGGMIARRKELMSPKADGLAGILRLVHEAAAAMDPRIAPPVADAARVVAWDAQGDPSAWPAAPADPLDALRAAAEAAGVRVDGRWGEERLRQEIASVGQREVTE